jgi:deoxyguanosine kinase
MTNQPYIGFEGPIGAGKTTLTNLLATHIGATAIFENVDGNEFLADFYGDKQRWALGMQLSFLISRHDQLRAVVSSRAKAVVADYTQAKDAIFARMLLLERELRLYESVSVGLNASVIRPDLVVYLDAKDEVLLDRIRHRNRAYEASIDRKYLHTLRDAYELYLGSAHEVRVLRFDTSTLNLASESELKRLYETIHSAASGHS